MSKLRQAMANNTGPTVGELFEPKKNPDNNQWYMPQPNEIRKNFHRRRAFLNKVDVTVGNMKELTDYYEQQQQRRLDQILFLQQNNQPVIIKHFLTQMHMSSKNDLKFNKLLFNRLYSSQFIPIFFYRKNLRDTILSNLIKSYYLDDKNTEKAITLVGHNFYNEMPPLQPEPNMSFKVQKLQAILSTYISLLKLYQVHKNNLKYTVAYEDFFIEKKPFVFSYLGNASDLQTTRQKQQQEYPMNYAANKDDYFVNSNVISTVIDEVIKDQTLSSVVKELGIIY